MLAGPNNPSLRQALCVGEVLESSPFWLAGESRVSWQANRLARECFENGQYFINNRKINCYIVKLRIRTIDQLSAFIEGLAVRFKNKGQ